MLYEGKAVDVRAKTMENKNRDIGVEHKTQRDMKQHRAALLSAEKKVLLCYLFITLKVSVVK